MSAKWGKKQKRNGRFHRTKYIEGGRMNESKEGFKAPCMVKTENKRRKVIDEVTIENVLLH